MASKSELLRAEAGVAELEEQLVEAKGQGEASRELKLAVREARQAFRELRAASAAEVAEDDGVARPDVVQVSTSVKGVS
jgi:hypothetical protein